MPFSSSSLVSSGFGLFGGDFGLKINYWWISAFNQFNQSMTYLPFGVSLRELDKDTTRLDSLDSFWASRSIFKYSSPDVKGSGVTRSGLKFALAFADNSIQDSASMKLNKNKKMFNLFSHFQTFVWICYSHLSSYNV